jgi:hypothetical protein
MDVKGKIDELTEKIKNDKALQSKFQKDPVGAVSDLTGLDLPKEQLEKIAVGVKTKLNLDSVGDRLGGLFGKGK